ncbi:glycoside hydrolase family 38 C-terminal domain-containing protein [Alkalibacterium pelagium]|uniref:Mannosylglycerate hydrolase n=1 Tax=Alkalibacterium pelagium TaxID=426702 RepID=A0A1H7MA72_9LACT|nr:glycoside hydrolase family 38 C-terminal domain-containing protein [Alkalibacterium pelagium]GEN51128.1 alpha-mannosidase [Alkalibacterium pelagium]SEL08064.1 mannosylglycerate hydrolase [Alkalibacterium pelagium]
MKRDIQILMHTHWDREWYFTKDETKVLLRNHMQEVMEYLETNPDTIYILDGQSVMIDDYLELEPEAEDRLRKLITSGSLRVGPWYTQTDLLLVHGESIYRNLYYGIKRAREFGNPMLVGYAPDTFGHASQMPQIYRQFGIDSTFFWRGFSELKAEKSDFIWKGIDGSEIVGVNLATGYQGAKYLENKEDELKNRMKKIMSVLDKYSASNARLIMNGHDQMPIQKNIKEVMTKIQSLYPDDTVRISDFETYVNALDKSELEVVSGELVDSKHARIHRTIGSTRMDIKLLNSEIENKLYNVLEPLAVIGEQAGVLYPHSVIEKVAKILFGTHAHDSIGGCNSDKVNQDIKQRLLNALEMVDTQIELHLRLLTMGDVDNDYTIAVVNALPEKRENQIVTFDMLTRSKSFILYDEEGNTVPYSVISQNQEDAGLIDRQVAARLQDIKVWRTYITVPVKSIEGLSIEYYTYEEVESNDASPEEKQESTIENNFGRVIIKDNQLHYKDLNNNRVYENILSIETGGDDGDSYDYSPPINDWILNSTEAAEINSSVIKTDHYQKMNIKLTMTVPETTQDRENKKANKEVAFTGTLMLYPDDSKLYVNLTHTNHTKDNRYRAVIKTGIQSEQVKVDGYLSSQNKPMYNEQALNIWKEDKWVEKPVSVETAQSFITLKNEESQCTVYTDGLKEYEVLDDRIHLTLFRTFSHLGKRNLVNRPGRPSGIEIETPDNQMLNETFTFRFAIDFKQTDQESKRAKEYLTPLIGYQQKEFNRFNINPRENVTTTHEHLSLELNELTVSAVKLTEEGDLFLRLFNPQETDVTVVLPENSYLATPMEEKISTTNSLTLTPQQIGNLIINR